MTKYKEYSFSAHIELIGINPFVFVPNAILAEIFKQAGVEKGPIPICGTVNGKVYKQTLVKYSGAWRLYISMIMLKDSPKRIGEFIDITIKFDPESRSFEAPKGFMKALAKNKEAENVFHSLSPSRKMEIIKYLANLKTEVALERNIQRAVNFLLGNARFIGRDKP